jgi:uncharacterized protein YeaO (DUF488 family)
MIKIKRAFDVPADEDGTRFLVDRIWPRGVKKEDLVLGAWLKEVAPSAQLRKAFGHYPKKWDEFKRLYAAELEHSKEHWQRILHAQQEGSVTLVYGVKDTVHNNAAALKEFLEKQQGKK